MNITIYSTTTCASCHVLTSWLDKEHVPYTKKNTDEDESALTEFMLVNEGNISVPFTVIEDDAGVTSKIIGLDMKRFKQILGL